LCCWNIAIYKWKVYNGKIEINFCHKISFSAGPHCQFRGIERQRRYKGVIRRRKSKKDRQYSGQKKKNKRTDNTLAKRKNRQYTDQKEEQTIHWPKGRADNALAKRKSRQYTGQKEEQTIHWPKGRADNTLAKRKSRQCTGQKEE
jgi:hypothetical protein